MKIEFKDKSYLEIKRDGDKVVVVIQAKDHQNSLKKITNSVEIDMEEFKKIIREVNS